jgi:hypothetical protein
MTIFNVKYSFIDKRFHSGPYIDILPQLETCSTEYDQIVSAIQESKKDAESIKLMSFNR